MISQRFISNRKEYSININLELNATNRQIIKSYLFSVKLNEYLDRYLKEELGPSRFSFSSTSYDRDSIQKICLQKAVNDTEMFYKSFDFDKLFEEMESNQWNLSTLFIEKGMNRYKISF